MSEPVIRVKQAKQAWEGQGIAGAICAHTDKAIRLWQCTNMM